MPTYIPPLFAFFFFSPWMAALAGIGAVSIPILIHLFSRRRFRIVTWAAMHFLMAAQRQNVRRMRLEQYVLLATRVLILFLLVLAMAAVTPWAEAFWFRIFPDSAVIAASNRRTHKIIVMDGSFSMGTRIGDRTAFEHARARALQILQSAPGGDGFSVVLMSSPAQRIVPEPSDDPSRVAEQVRAVRLPHGNADLAGALLAVEDMLKRSPAKFDAREVYFLTDMQKSTWAGKADSKLPAIFQRLQSHAQLIYVDVGEDGIGNIAVTDLRMGPSLATTNTPISFIATLHNYNPDESKAVRVEMLVGKARKTAADPPFELHVVGQELVRVTPGKGGSTVSFTHKFALPGDYAVQVRVESDALDLDDSRTIIVTVKDTVPVMLVNGKPAVEEYDKATGYLRDALQPAEKGILRESPVRPKVVSETQFADAALGDLAPFDCVFLCDVARLSHPEVRRLETHLKRGGGVVLCLGPHVDLEAYNRLLYKNGEGIMPARLVSIQQTTGERPFMFYADLDDFRKPPLQAFDSVVGRFNLLEPRFYQYIRAELPAKSRGRKILSFVPEPQKPAAAPAVPVKPDEKRIMPTGDPAIVEAPFQRGRVVLVTTTVNKDWNNWPDRPALLALAHEVLHFAVAGRLHGQSLLVGDPIEELPPSATSGLEYTIATPDGRTVRQLTQATEEVPVLQYPDTEQSGIYRLTVGQHPQEFLFAVNVPTATDGQESSESNLIRVHDADLHEAYPGFEFQIVSDPKNVHRAIVSGSGDGQRIGPGMGPFIARIVLFIVLALMLIEVVLAWKLAHWSKSGVGSTTPAAEGKLLPGIVGAVAAICFVAIAGVLIHTAFTGDFLGFLPESWRATVESTLGVPKPVPGESTRWRLEYTAYLQGDSATQPWLIGALAVGACVLVLGIYLREGATASAIYRLLLAGLRMFLVLLVLVVFLPQLQLWFERQGWPDVAILIDDSMSMSTTDNYQDAQVREAVARLIPASEIPQPQRLQLIQALLTSKDSDWLGELLDRRKVKLHIWHCSTKAAALAHITEPEHRDEGAEKVLGLRATGEGSRLGEAVRTVLNAYRGSSLAAVIMLTDGVTTEGEDLPQVGQFASQMGVPLYFVGIGDQHEARDLIVHDVQADESCFVNDRLIFEGRLTAQGYTNLPPLEVKLSEKTQEGLVKELKREKVVPDPQGKPVKFRLTHKPTETGEKTYIIEVPVLPDESQRNNNSAERTVFVREAKPVHVLYIEGYPRYEFRFIKTLLEREAASPQGNKSVDLKVLLLDADDDYPAQDRTARADFPTKEELNQFDVVILGDVDPRHRKLEKNLKLLVDFVRERGAGLLVIGGERNSPNSFKDTPLADILPIQITGTPADAEADRRDGYRPQLTPVGRMHPIFRFSPDETENAAIWGRLSEMYWFADGYRLQPAAEVLAVHPRRKMAAGKLGATGDDRLPLVVQHFVGAGRCMFFGFDETWRWRLREDEVHFNTFWNQTVKYLARSSLGGIRLALNRSTPYRKGEPIQITVRFPDDAPAPGPETSVKVVVERRPLKDQADGEIEVETLQLAKLEGSRATYEAIKTRTPPGEYRFWLSSPTVTGPKPRAEARVLPPPGEMEKLRMNQSEMERAAEQSKGKFYTLADAARLLDDLPTTSRVALNTPGPPWLLWNHFMMFTLVVGLFAGEWILRKRKHLL